MGVSDPIVIAAHLKQIYAEYRHTAELEEKARFFSPDCRQICRPAPAFSARDRDTIMKYLRETSGKDTENIQEFMEDPDKTTTATAPTTETSASVSASKKSFYTIRPLTDGEIEFGSDEIVAPAGFDSAADAKLQAEREGWVGMRVDLWDDEGTDHEGRAKGMLVKVQYWWKRDAGVWSQILHDIMYLGSRDGTEGSEGDILE
ncbi:hypothetical protein Daus18300_014212 [Diaporthe australafricana]|uniref:SnoaL-like domain-containing protein n=1 Tax=Diaporthe australafricana TaxID=127596 RepID=A0ABR3VW57_9PEZI